MNKYIILLLFITIANCKQGKRNIRKTKAKTKKTTIKVLPEEIEVHDYRKIVPFKYNDKWGIVDSLSNEIVSPKYTNGNISKDFIYAEFDGIDLYNLKTGKKQKALGRYISSITINNHTHYLFSNKRKSYLVNFETNKTTTIFREYTYLEIMELYDNEKKKRKTIIVGHLGKGKIMLLENNKDLTPFIKNEFTIANLDFIENDNKIIGFSVKQNGNYNIYNHQLQKIKELKAPKKTGYYNSLTDEALGKLPHIFKVKTINTSCFKCEIPWTNDWDLSSSEIQKLNKNNYYITANRRDNYILKSNKNEKFKLDIYLDYFSFPNLNKSITFKNDKHEESLFFYDSKYIKRPHILFPEKYFNNQKF